MWASLPREDIDSPLTDLRQVVGPALVGALGPLLDIIGIHEAWHSCTLDLGRETLEKSDPEARLERVVSRLRETGMGMYADMNPVQLKRIVNVYQTHSKAQARYDSQRPIAAPIVLLRAEESLTGESDGKEQERRDWGWSRFTQGELFIEHAPGNHESMMNTPHVAVLAQKLANYLMQRS